MADGVGHGSAAPSRISIDGSPPRSSRRAYRRRTRQTRRGGRGRVQTHKLGAALVAPAAAARSAVAAGASAADQLAARSSTVDEAARGQRASSAAWRSATSASVRTSRRRERDGLWMRVVAQRQIGSRSNEWPSAAVTGSRITSSELGRGDVFFVLGSPQASRATALEWRAAFDYFSVAQLLLADGTGQLQKLLLVLRGGRVQRERSRRAEHEEVVRKADREEAGRARALEERLAGM